MTSNIDHLKKITPSSNVLSNIDLPQNDYVEEKKFNIKDKITAL